MGSAVLAGAAGLLGAEEAESDLDRPERHAPLVLGEDADHVASRRAGGQVEAGRLRRDLAARGRRACGARARLLPTPRAAGGHDGGRDDEKGDEAGSHGLIQANNTSATGAAGPDDGEVAAVELEAVLALEQVHEGPELVGGQLLDPLAALAVQMLVGLVAQVIHGPAMAEVDVVDD